MTDAHKNVKDAAMKKDAIDPAFLMALAVAGGIGGWVGRRLGLKMRARKTPDFTVQALLGKQAAAADGATNARGTVGTVLEGKIHESFTVAADKLYQAGLLGTKERIGLSGVIGDVLKKFREGTDKGVTQRKMTQNAYDLLKSAVSERYVKEKIVARTLAQRPRATNWAIAESAKGLQKASPAPLAGDARRLLRSTISGVRKMTVSKPADVSAITTRLRARMDPQGKLFV